MGAMSHGPWSEAGAWRITTALRDTPHAPAQARDIRILGRAAHRVAELPVRGYTSRRCRKYHKHKHKQGRIEPCQLWCTPPDRTPHHPSLGNTSSPRARQTHLALSNWTWRARLKPTT